MRKKIVPIALSLSCALTLGALAGCSGTATSAQNTEQAANRAYMSQVNQVMTTLDEKLDAFVDAVANNDVVTMKTQANRALETLSTLESIEAPDALKDVQSSYVSGASSLKEALNTYIDAYSSSDVGALSAETMATIQDKYTQGVTALKDADKKASELPN